MKLSTVKFQNVCKTQELSKDAQKQILGGYNGSSCCFYVDNSHQYHCTNSPNQAYSNAGGSYGTWACETEEAHQRCAGSTNFC